MATWVVARRIKWGILCLPLAGLVSLQSLVVAGDYVYPTDDLRGYAEQITSARYQVGLLVNYLQMALFLVGGFALYAYLAGGRAERWALAGLVLQCVTAVGAGLVLGLDVPMIPAAEAYLEGQKNALASVEASTGFTDFPLLIQLWAMVSIFLFNILSTLFFGIAVWRSGTLPQGAAVLWVGAVVLGAASFNPSTDLGAWIGALLVALDLGGSGWIAWSVWQQPLDRKTGLT